MPRAHTCFNTLSLPPYTSFATMRSKLEMAIKEGVGFGLT